MSSSLPCFFPGQLRDLRKTQMSKIHLFAFNLILKFPAQTMES